MKNKVFALIKKRWKWASALLIVALVAFIAQGTGGTGSEFVSLVQVERGTLELTLSADGSVSNHQSVELNPKSAGPITDIAVVEGETVFAGQLLLALESSDAAFALRDAELDLQSAQVKLAQVQEAAAATDLKMAENALSQAQQDLEDVTTDYAADREDMELTLSNAQEDLDQERVDAYSTVADAFAELPATLESVDDLLNGHDYAANQSNLAYYYDQARGHTSLQNQADDLKDAYAAAQSTYNDALDLYNAVSVNSESEEIVALINTTYDAVEELSVLLKDLNVFLLSIEDLYSDNETVPSDLDSHLESVENVISTLNPELSTLSNQVQALNDLDQAIEVAERDLSHLDTTYESDLKQAQLNVEAKELALEDLNEGPDENDVRAQEILVEKAQNALAEAQHDYEDLFLTAPFDGVITDIAVDLGQTVSTATAAFTLVSNQKMVNVSLNEIDVSQIELGQSGVATFDAFPGVEVPVLLAFVSEVHDETSAVVEYESHLTFAGETPDLKEGMSAHVTILLNRVENALLVPKTSLQVVDEETRIEVVQASSDLQALTLYPRSDLSIQSKAVTVGTRGADQVEILSGLEEGEWVIVFSAEEQVSAMPTDRPTGAFGEGAIDNGPASNSDE